jgi:hypothetical protein
VQLAIRGKVKEVPIFNLHDSLDGKKEIEEERRGEERRGEEKRVYLDTYNSSLAMRPNPLS